VYGAGTLSEGERMKFGIKPVSLKWSNYFGNDPKYLPVPGSLPILGVNPPKWADDCTRYMLSNGDIYEYLGISGNIIDNKGRINGWGKMELQAADVI